MQEAPHGHVEPPGSRNVFFAAVVTLGLAVTATIQNCMQQSGEGSPVASIGKADIAPALLQDTNMAVRDCLISCSPDDMTILTNLMCRTEISLEEMHVFATKLSPKFQSKLYPLLELFRDHPEIGRVIPRCIRGCRSKFNFCDRRWIVCCMIPEHPACMNDPHLLEFVQFFLQQEEPKERMRRPCSTAQSREEPASPSKDLPVEQAQEIWIREIARAMQLLTPKN
jgi:hypothetical protein